MECALSTKRPSAVKQEPLFFCSCGCEMPTVVLTRTKTAQTENTNVLESVFSPSHALFWIVGEEAEEEINQVFFSPSFVFVPCQIIWYDPSEISGKLSDINSITFTSDYHISDFGHEWQRRPFFHRSCHILTSSLTHEIEMVLLHKPKQALGEGKKKKKNL